ncbi:tetratricopeptide repeat protein [Flammeovirga agarivorans]|uniref:Tetratricopeptide repeat protein n=1 Tax=Flammeovirga agarivorans TaxID=2726742 RepID=A0A7X8SMM8_9BACT|nr:tetratricopeptide repeat protein [Flammeovirga agarivorans]NLR93039.1 tetratricopeptide repeat protein [Flammeovirga agarivorans]
MNKNIFISIFLIFNFSFAFGQNKVDSLWNVWTDINREDTTRLEALFEHSREIIKKNTDSVFTISDIGYQFASEKNLIKYQSSALVIRGKALYRKGRYTEAENTFNEALILAREAKDSLSVSRAIYGIGSTYYARGEYDTTLEYYKKSYAISSLLNDKVRMADVMNNIGIINLIQKDYEEAEKNLKRCHELYTEAGILRSAPLNNLAILKSRKGDVGAAVELQFEALKINEKKKNDYSIAYTYMNIANTYSQLKDDENYLKYTQKSYDIRKRIDDKAGMLRCLSGFGIFYNKKKEYDKALEYYNEALSIALELDRKLSISNILINKVLIKLRTDQLEEVLEMINKTLEINKKLDNKKGIANCYYSYGIYYKKKGNYDKALYYVNKAMTLAEGLEIEQTRDFSKELYKIYSTLGQSQKALKNYEIYIETRDSVLNLESQQDVLHQQYTYENEKRALSDSLNYANKQLIHQEKLTQSRNQKTALIIILTLVTMFTVFAVNRVRFTRIQKRIIEGQVVELNELNENLEEKVIERSQKIADREEQLRYALEASNDGIWDWNIKSNHMIFSPALFTMLGYAPYEFKEKQEEIQDRIHPDDLKKIGTASYLDLILQTKEGNMVTEARLKNKVGKYIWVQIKGKVVSKDTSGNPDRVVGTFTDITSIKQKAQDILNAVMTTEDIERNRISKDIHDGLQQTLTVSSLNFQKVKKSIGELPAEVIETFDIGYDYLQKSITESRSVAHHLMPKAIVDFGIIKAFEDLIYEVDKSADTIEFEFFHNFGEHQINNQQVKLTLYRILQEGVNNIFKYSKATKVDIQLKNYEDIYMLTIEDNGVGFDAKKILKEESGMGFKGMKNRLDAIDGFLEVESKEGRGTTILVEINKNF